MQNTLARIITLIFHPLIMPAAGLLLLLNSGTYLNFLTFPQMRAIFLILFIGTVILPLSLIPVFILQDMTGSLMMEDHRHRIMPLFFTFIFHAFTWYMLLRLKVPGIISAYSVTACLTVLLCALVTIKWKISLHMTAMGAIAGTLLATAFRFNINLLAYLSLAFLAGGLTGWARLSLKAHTPAQVYAGYLGGLLTAFLVMYHL